MKSKTLPGWALAVVSWLESAVLVEEAGAWRIQFFHSTRLPAKDK